MFRGHGQSTWPFPSVGTPQLIPFADGINRLIFPKMKEIPRFLPSRIRDSPSRREKLSTWLLSYSDENRNILITMEMYTMIKVQIEWFWILRCLNLNYSNDHLSQNRRNRLCHEFLNLNSILFQAIRSWFSLRTLFSVKMQIKRRRREKWTGRKALNVKWPLLLYLRLARGKLESVNFENSCWK